MLKEWSDAYGIGIPEIDAQHQGFFEAAHRLHEAILDFKGAGAVSEALTFMRTYAERHFRAEEAFMERHRYPGLAEHKRRHVAFFRRLDGLADDLDMFGPNRELADRALDLTQDWLVDHITDEDMLYALHVKSGSGASSRQDLDSA